MKSFKNLISKRKILFWPMVVFMQLSFFLSEYYAEVALKYSGKEAGYEMEWNKYAYYDSISYLWTFLFISFFVFSLLIETCSKNIKKRITVPIILLLVNILLILLFHNGYSL